MYRFIQSISFTQTPLECDFQFLISIPFDFFKTKWRTHFHICILSLLQRESFCNNNFWVPILILLFFTSMHILSSLKWFKIIFQFIMTSLIQFTCQCPFSSDTGSLISFFPQVGSYYKMGNFSLGFQTCACRKSQYRGISFCADTHKHTHTLLVHTIFTSVMFTAKERLPNKSLWWLKTDRR